jgi:putative ABC transport system permease protein
METLLHDLRYACRSLLRQPSFALTGILTLALGIGATTAIFSAVHAILLRPLPYPEADRIVALTNFWTQTGRRGSTVSAPDFHDWKVQNQSFASFAYFNRGETSVTSKGAADYAFAYAVTPEFFDVLGARAVVGRLLTKEEQQPGGPMAVVLTHAFWKKQFGGDARAIGSSIKFDDRLFTVAGVLGPGIRYPARADIYYPAWVNPETPSRSGHNYRVLARLKPGVSLAAAQADMSAIAARLETQHPNSNAGKSAAVVPLLDLLVGNTRQMLYILFGAVGLLLLISCANVANLQLARATSREREMVVRTAVGAGRGRLVRQLLTESAVLGLAAGACGVWLAQLGVAALAALAPADLPRLDEIRIDITALGFAVTIALAASILFGLAPALHVSRVQLADGLRQSGKAAGRGPARQVFVVAEVALAVVLVFAAALLGRSLIALASVEMGFSPDRLLVLRTDVPVANSSGAMRATMFYRDLMTELRVMPGITAIGGVTSLPTAVRSDGSYWIEGGPRLEDTGVRAPQALLTVVTPDYFRTLRVPLKSGRDFGDRDRHGAPLVAIVNESLARASFQGQEPIGRRIQCGLDNLEFMTIVGVVADIRTAGPSLPAQPEIYMPYEQHPGPASALNLVVRTEVADPLTLVETISRAIRQRNSDVPVRASTMEGTLETASAAPRFRTIVLTIFAGVALLLAVAGVYGVMTYAVNQRIPELGLRLALGATHQNVMSLILWQGAKLAFAGLAIGLALALLAGRGLQGILYGVTPRDPLILALVTAGVAGATLVACYLPGRRAVRVDPMIALRAE